MSEQKKKKYTNLGTMIRAKKRDANDENEAPRFYLKLEQNKDKNGKIYGDQVFPITLANGKKINDGDIISMFDKRSKFKKLVEENKMDQETADRLASFLLFDLCLVEEVNSEDKANTEGIPF